MQCSRSTVQRIERGEHPKIEIESFFALSDALNVSIRWLYGQDVPQERPVPLRPNEMDFLRVLREFQPDEQVMACEMLREWKATMKRAQA